MKNKNRLYMLAVATAALTLNTTTAVGQVFTSEDVIRNRAVAASPRAKEEFPGLTRSVTESPSSKMAVTTSMIALAVVKENGALASSPRMKEQFPELARRAVSSSEGIVATRTAIDPLTEVRRNCALAASPRMRELFPELAREPETSIELAPLK